MSVEDPSDRDVEQLEDVSAKRELRQFSVRLNQSPARTLRSNRASLARLHKLTDINVSSDKHAMDESAGSSC